MPTPSLFAFFLFLLTVQIPGQSAKIANDANEAVFVKDLVGSSEGAPPARNLGKLVLLTDLSPNDSYYKVVRLLQQQKKPVATVRYAKGKIQDCRTKLKQLLPEFVLVVTRPERIDVNQHFTLLELAADLDKDPFLDVAIGYVTGATADEALAFTRRFLARSKKKKNTLPKTAFEFGPSKNKTLQEGGPIAHPIAKGWKKRWVYHGPTAEFRKRKTLLQGNGILRAAGHGMPAGVVDGLSGQDLREQQLDLSPAIYFSGPCYCGVTGNWFEQKGGVIKQQRVDPMESFGLAVLASGVTALFAGLDPDRGEQSSQEMEHLFCHGDSLGHAMKETYDSTTVALRRSHYQLFRYKKNGPRPQTHLSFTMIGGAAARVLFSDPTYVPFSKCAQPPFPVTLKKKRKSLVIDWQSRRKPPGFLSVDVYRCNGGWTNRIAFRQEIPVKLARSLKTFDVAKVAAKEGPLPYRYPTAMIERWGGKAYVHVYTVFKPGGLPTQTRDLEVRFLFGK